MYYPEDVLSCPQKKSRLGLSDIKESIKELKYHRGKAYVAQ
jgi:oligoribonuclease (3'-5' exoribonuclease)